MSRRYWMAANAQGFAIGCGDVELAQCVNREAARELCEAANGTPAAFLDWLADYMDANPRDAELCRRIAGNVRKVAGLS